MMGNISIVMSVAPAVGPVFAGFILAYLDWRWFFVIMIPIALGALALGYRLMVNVTTPREAPLDYLSVVLSAIAFGGIVYGLSGFGVEDGVAADQSVHPARRGCGDDGAVRLAPARLAPKGNALLDLSTLKAGNFTISVTMISILMLAMFGTIILLPIYLATVIGFEIWQIGLLMMPGSLMMGLLGPFVGRLFDKVGPRPLIIPAMGLVCARALGHDAARRRHALAVHPRRPSGDEPRLRVPVRAAVHHQPRVGAAAALQPRLGAARFRAAGCRCRRRGAVRGADVGAARPASPSTGACRSKLWRAVSASPSRSARSIAIFAFVASFFVKRPAAQEGGWGGH